MIVLGVETSTDATLLGLIDEAQPIVEIRSLLPFTHSENINLMLNQVFEISKQNFENLGLLSVSIGPGYFTALRVGLSFVKAIELTHRIPVVGINTLDALANEIPFCYENLKITPVIDAQKGQVYTATFVCKNGKPERVSDYAIKKPSEIESGEGVVVGMIKNESELRTEKIFRIKFPSALTVARLGLEKYRHQGADDIDLLEPFYMRITDAEAKFGETDKTYPIRE